MFQPSNIKKYIFIFARSGEVTKHSPDEENSINKVYLKIRSNFQIRFKFTEEKIE